MSCLRLQPASKTAEIAAATSERRADDSMLVILHLAYMPRMKRLQKAGRFGNMELGIAGFDAEEKTVTGSVLGETMDVEEWMMGLRQAVQCQHTEDRGQGSPQNSHLKSYRDECGPAIQRPSADVH